MKQVGRPPILNDDRVPDDHVCHKCKKDNTKVGFKIQNDNPSQWCNICLYGMKTPRHIRRENIAKRINDYQNGIK